MNNKPYFGIPSMKIHGHPIIKDIRQWDTLVFNSGAIFEIWYIHDIGHDIGFGFHLVSINDQTFVCETGTICIPKGFSILYDSKLNILTHSLYHCLEEDISLFFDLLGYIEHRYPRIKDKIDLL